MVFKFQRAEGVGDVLVGILQRVGEVVHGIDAPCAARVVVFRMVKNRWPDDLYALRDIHKTEIDLSSMPKKRDAPAPHHKINLPLAMVSALQCPMANRQDSCVLPPDLVRYEKKGRRLRRKEALSFLPLAQCSVCMEPGFIDLTAENIADQHLCCIIPQQKKAPPRRGG